MCSKVLAGGDSFAIANSSHVIGVNISMQWLVKFDLDNALDSDDSQASQKLCCIPVHGY